MLYGILRVQGSEQDAAASGGEVLGDSMRGWSVIFSRSWPVYLSRTVLTAAADCRVECIMHEGAVRKVASQVNSRTVALTRCERP